MKPLNEILLEKLQKKKRRQENFDNLKQQDRIEYLLSLDRLEKEKTNINPFSILPTFFMVIGYFILLAVCSYQVSEKLMISILNLIFPIARVGIVLLIFAFLIDFCFGIKDKEKLDKLKKKFLKE